LRSSPARLKQVFQVLGSESVGLFWWRIMFSELAVKE
jgi:hypothetical protein